MVMCTNFPLDEDDCKRCKEYPCDIVRGGLMICPKCGGIMSMCGVGAWGTDQLEFYTCSNCGNVYHPFLKTEEEILHRIEEIDKEVEAYEVERERKYSKKLWEFWK